MSSGHIVKLAKLERSEELTQQHAPEKPFHDLSVIFLNGGNMPTTVTITNCSGKVRQIESGSYQVTKVTGLTDNYLQEAGTS